MMHIDIKTIINLLFIGNSISAAILIAYIKGQDRQAPFIQFISAKILQALAWLLLGLRGDVNDILSIYLGNSLLLTAFTLEGLALATVKKSNRQFSILFAVLGALGIISFLSFAGYSGSVRIAAASSATILIYATMALLILRAENNTTLHKTIAAAYLLFSFILIFRIWLAMADEDMTLTSNIPIQTLTFLPLYLLMLVGGIGFILLLKENNDQLLQESEEKYRTLVEQASEAIAIIQDQKFVFVNPRLANLLGVQRAELIGQPFPPYLWPDDRERVTANFERRMRGETFTDRYDIRITGPEGTPIWLVLSAIRIRWQGRPASLNLMTDITERKHHEEEREKIIGELQKALAEIKTLSGLLPICASCKKIRDDTGYWNQIEIYIKNHSQATFTHGICPDCMKQLYPEVFQKLHRLEADTTAKEI